MRPERSATIAWHIESPRPVPLPIGFVVKNGSKTLARTSRDIPTPLSDISTHTHPSSSGLVTTRISFFSSDPSGIAWAALMSRVRKSWPRRPWSAHTGETSPRWRDTRAR
jgi:hypothetical protein